VAAEHLLTVGLACPPVTEQQTFVSTTSQLSGAQLATCVSCLPGVQWGVPGLGTVAGVVLGDVGGGSGVVTLGADPADSLFLVHTLGVIFQLLLLLEYGVLGPPLDAVDVELPCLPLYNSFPPHPPDEHLHAPFPCKHSYLSRNLSIPIF
jgi:hypothetical protein